MRKEHFLFHRLIWILCSEIYIHKIIFFFFFVGQTLHVRCVRLNFHGNRSQYYYLHEYFLCKYSLLRISLTLPFSSTSGTPMWPQNMSLSSLTCPSAGHPSNSHIDRCGHRIYFLLHSQFSPSTDHPISPTRSPPCSRRLLVISFAEIFLIYTYQPNISFTSIDFPGRLRTRDL